MFELGLKHYVGEDDKNIVHLAVAPITHAAGLLCEFFSARNGLNIVHEKLSMQNKCCLRFKEARLLISSYLLRIL